MKCVMNSFYVIHMPCKDINIARNFREFLGYTRHQQAVN